MPCLVSDVMGKLSRASKESGETHPGSRGPLGKAVKRPQTAALTTDAGRGGVRFSAAAHLVFSAEAHTEVHNAPHSEQVGPHIAYIQ